MKQLTVRGIDETLHLALKEGASEVGLSVNRYVVKILRQAVGEEKPQTQKGPPYHDLDWMIGSWTDEEADEFDQILAEIRVIDPEMWL